MQEKHNKLKDYQYPAMEIIPLEDKDIVTFSGLSSGELFYDSDENQGEWD